MATFGDGTITQQRNFGNQLLVALNRRYPKENGYPIYYQWPNDKPAVYEINIVPWNDETKEHFIQALLMSGQFKPLLSIQITVADNTITIVDRKKGSRLLKFTDFQNIPSALADDIINLLPHALDEKTRQEIKDISQAA